MKKNQIKKQMGTKSGFQPLPFFIAMAAILPLQTGNIEITRTIHLPQMEMQAKQKIKTTRSPASLNPVKGETKTLIENISHFDFGGQVQSTKDWQIDGGAIDLLRWKPDAKTEITVTHEDAAEIAAVAAE